MEAITDVRVEPQLRSDHGHVGGTTPEFTLHVFHVFPASDILASIGVREMCE